MAAARFGAGVRAREHTETDEELPRFRTALRCRRGVPAAGAPVLRPRRLAYSRAWVGVRADAGGRTLWAYPRRSAKPREKNSPGSVIRGFGHRCSLVGGSGLPRRRSRMLKTYLLAATLAVTS